MIALALMLQTAPLELTCNGFGSTETAANVVETVNVTVDGETARIRYPQSLYLGMPWQRPEWREMSNVTVDDRFIRARFSLNPLNRPSVVIDRATGTITIQALGGTGFRGECVAVDQAQRRF